MVCRIPGNRKSIYLTFDDGPTPVITEQVLALLSLYKAKATFFCLGKQVEKNKELYQAIIDGGHAVGIHGYDHLHGWYTPLKDYLSDLQSASDLIRTTLFRPPYGKLRRSQYKEIDKIYKIIYWTRLSWDFHPWVSREMCLKISLKAISNGAILVFHDIPKASEKLLYVLPKLLEELHNQGYKAELIPGLV